MKFSHTILWLRTDWSSSSDIDLACAKTLLPKPCDPLLHRCNNKAENGAGSEPDREQCVAAKIGSTIRIITSTPGT